MNPFDDTSGRFQILVNAKDQYSLWPDDVRVPAGWRTVCAGLDHEEALEQVDSVWIELSAWTDLQPVQVGNGDVVGG